MNSDKKQRAARFANCPYVKHNRHAATLKRNVVGLTGILIVMLLTACSNKPEASEKDAGSITIEKIDDAENVQETQTVAPADTDLTESAEEKTEQMENTEQTEDTKQAEKEDSSQQNLSEEIAIEISHAEEQEKEIEKKQREAVTQMDMNLTAAEMYQMWDDTLNIVWGLLEANMDEADMEILRKEEREWIADKDAEVQAAGQECEGGSIQPSVEASVAADLTKARVYELAEYAK